MVGTLVAAALALTQYDPVPVQREPSAGPVRPLGRIVRQPLYLLAVLAGMVSYAGMSFIMTATPISMHVHDHHSDGATAWVIQSPLLAMYVPSLFSGALLTTTYRPAERHRAQAVNEFAVFGTQALAALLVFGPSPSDRESRARSP